jgi:hypothetical protein
MNGNLIPEKRADKRGNLVTRWVKMFGGSNDSAKDLPSPGMAVTKPSRKFSPEQQASLIAKFEARYNPDSSTNENIKYIADKDPVLIEQISNAVHGGDNVDLGFWASMVRNGSRIEYMPEPADHLKKMRESLVVFPLMRQIAARGGMDIESNEPHDVVYTVHETMKTSKIRKPDEETVAAVAAVVYGTRAYIWNGEITTPEYKNIRNDVEYVKDRLEDMVHILPDLRRRNTMDRGVIESLLSSPTQAMREGEL